MINSNDLHLISNKAKLTMLLSNVAMMNEEQIDAVVITQDMVPPVIMNDIKKFKQLYFTFGKYGRFFVDRVDLEPAIVWYTEKHDKVERRFSDLFKGKLASCPGCGGKLFRFGPYWMCRECPWDSVPNLGFVPLPPIHSS